MSIPPPNPTVRLFGQRRRRTRRRAAVLPILSLSPPFSICVCSHSSAFFCIAAAGNGKEKVQLKMLLVLLVRVILERNVGQKGTSDDQKPAVPPPAQQDWGASYAQRLEDPILSPGPGGGGGSEGPKNSVAVVDQCHRTRNGHRRRDSKKQTAKSCFCPPPLLTLFSLPT